MTDIVESIKILDEVNNTYIRMRAAEKGYWSRKMYAVFSDNLTRLKHNNQDTEALINIFELCDAWYATRDNGLRNLILDATWDILELKLPIKQERQVSYAEAVLMARDIERLFPLAATLKPRLRDPSNYMTPAIKNPKEDRYCEESFEREKMIWKKTKELRARFESAKPIVRNQPSGILNFLYQLFRCCFTSNQNNVTKLQPTQTEVHTEAFSPFIGSHAKLKEVGGTNTNLLLDIGQESSVVTIHFADNDTHSPLHQALQRDQAVSRYQMR